MIKVAGIGGAGRLMGADLYYYRARYYSPRLGRFLQIDPVGANDNLNLYEYGNSDPANWTDPDGESAILAVAIPVLAGAILIAGCNADPACKEGAQDALQHGLDSLRRTVRGAASAIAEGLVYNQDGSNSGDNSNDESGDKGQKDDRPSNVKNPQEAEESISKEQDKSRQGRPSIEDETDHAGEPNEWEGAKKRPKSRDIESTTKTNDRAKQDRNRNWQDQEDDEDLEDELRRNR